MNSKSIQTFIKIIIIKLLCLNLNFHWKNMTMIQNKQIILNILTNAIKYTRNGYVDFNVSSIVKDNICRLIISVEDSGIGIKQENIDKLFSKFERLDLESCYY